MNLSTPISTPVSIVVTYELLLSLPSLALLGSLIYVLLRKKTPEPSPQEEQDGDLALIKPCGCGRGKLEIVELGVIGLLILSIVLHVILNIWKSATGIEERVHCFLVVLPVFSFYSVKVLHLLTLHSNWIIQQLPHHYRLSLYSVFAFCGCGFISSFLLLVFCCPGELKNDCWGLKALEAAVGVGVVDVFSWGLVVIFGGMVVLKRRVLAGRREEGKGFSRALVIILGLGVLVIALGMVKTGLLVGMLEGVRDGKEGRTGLTMQILERLEVLFAVFGYSYRFGQGGLDWIEKISKRLRGKKKEEGDGIEVATGRCFDYVKGELVEYKEEREVDVGTSPLRKEIGEIELVPPSRRNTN